MSTSRKEVMVPSRDPRCSLPSQDSWQHWVFPATVPTALLCREVLRRGHQLGAVGACPCARQWLRLLRRLLQKRHLPGRLSSLFGFQSPDLSAKLVFL